MIPRPSCGGESRAVQPDLYLDLTLNEKTEGLIPYRMTGVGDSLGLEFHSRGCGQQQSHVWICLTH